MVSLSSTSVFDRIADKKGEDVTVYNATQTISSDYGSVATDTGIASGGTSEKAIIQPQSEKRIQMSEGRLKLGDAFGLFKASSVVTDKSLVSVGTKLYKVISLQDVRYAASTHHFEADLKFLRLTS